MNPIGKFARDCAGTVTIEFALILPIMFLLLFGTFEVSEAVIVYMKLDAAADTVADLVAQTQQGKTLQSTNIDDDYTAAQLVMMPSSGAGLGLAVASISFDPTTGVPSVAWQQTRGGAAAMSDAASGAIGLGSPGDSVIVATATYTYTSILQYVMPVPIVMSQRTYARPRLTLSVPYD